MPATDLPDLPGVPSRRDLATLVLARITLNVPFRIVYPFLPAIARGLGVPLESAGLLITVRSLVSTASPLFGVLADRYGRRRIMLLGMSALVVGAALVALSPNLLIAALAFAFLGFSKASFDPAMQAYVGDAVPYAVRGRIMGILELPWALSWFLGVPLAGFAIAAAGWRAPFWIVAGAGLIGFTAVWLFCPSCDGGTTGTLPSSPRHWRSLLSGAPLAVLLVSALMVFAIENVFVVYGAWLEARHGLAVSALGLVSLVICGAELVAELTSAGLVDRLGKRRAVLASLILSCLAYLALPRLDSSLPLALAGIVLLFLAFEFGIVSLLPLVSEIAPGSRALLMALNVSAMSLGRTASSITGPRLWGGSGLTANAVVSAAAVAAAAVILLVFVRERLAVRQGHAVEHE